MSAIQNTNNINNNIIISVRGDKCSRFVEVRSFLNSESTDKCLKLYQDFIFNFNSYDLKKPKPVEVPPIKPNLSQTERPSPSMAKRIYAFITSCFKKKIENPKLSNPPTIPPKPPVDPIETLKKVNDLIYNQTKNKISNSKSPGWKFWAAWVKDYKMRNLEKLYSLAKKHIDIQADRHKEKVRQESVIKDLLAKRVEDPEKELERLMQISYIKDCIGPLTLTVRQKIALGHSLEIQEALKSTHNVINHGQKFGLLMLNILIQELKKNYTQHQYEDYQPLRHEAHLRHSPQDRDAEWFKENIHKFSNGDHNFRAELICGDYNLFSNSFQESALYFFSQNTNIKMDFLLLEELAKAALTDYILDEKIRNQLFENLKKCFSKLQKKEPGGILYTICIPKNKYNKMVYHSGPFGFITNYNQARVVAKTLSPEEGVHIFMNSVVDDKAVAQFQEEVALLIQKAQLRL